MARRGTIRLNYKRDGAEAERVEVPALIFGDKYGRPTLAVHKLHSQDGIPTEGAWCVSHWGSGLKLGAPFELQRDARALAKKLQKRPEWAKVGADGSYPDPAEFKALGEAVKEATYEVHHPEG